jgi:hypothetical protein
MHRWRWLVVSQRWSRRVVRDGRTRVRRNRACSPYESGEWLRRGLDALANQILAREAKGRVRVPPAQTAAVDPLLPFAQDLCIM